MQLSVGPPEGILGCFIRLRPAPGQQVGEIPDICPVCIHKLFKDSLFHSRIRILVDYKMEHIVQFHGVHLFLSIRRGEPAEPFVLSFVSIIRLYFQAVTADI
ncbi:hypothetical protein D3C73_1499860 [compost metagenome]